MFNPWGVQINENIFDHETICTAIVVAHGVNTRGVMGAGFAGLVANQYPQVKAEYQQECRSGNLQPGGVHVARASEHLFVANVASQQVPGRDARVEWLVDGLNALYDLMAAKPDITFDVRMPLIGAGIGGLSPTVSVNTIYGIARDRRARNIMTTLYLRSQDRVCPEAFHALETLEA